MKNRKRNIIINFRVSQAEKQLIENRIQQSGLRKADFFIRSCLYQKIHVTGNIKTFDEMKRRMKMIDEHLCEINQTEELDFEVLESLRTVLELLDDVYSKPEHRLAEGAE